MKSFIQITRHLYEEPYHLNLVIVASNGLAMGSLEFYSNASDLKDIGEALKKFNYKQTSTYLYELGSERSEDNFAHYFCFKVFPTGRGYRSYAIQIRMNNNEKLRNLGWPHLHQESDFCIEVDIDELGKLAQLFIGFSKLEQNRLYWSPEANYLDNAVKEPPLQLEPNEVAFEVLPKYKKPPQRAAS